MPKIVLFSLIACVAILAGCTYHADCSHSHEHGDKPNVTSSDITGVWGMKDSEGDYILELNDNGKGRYSHVTSAEVDAIEFEYTNDNGCIKSNNGPFDELHWDASVTTDGKYLVVSRNNEFNAYKRIK